MRILIMIIITQIVSKWGFGVKSEKSELCI
jgi:hypothetical protein